MLPIQQVHFQGRGLRHRRQRERDPVRVIDVHRLPGGEHHVVPEVDEQADAAFADTGEPVAQPQRRGHLTVKLELNGRHPLAHRRVNDADQPGPRRGTRRLRPGHRPAQRQPEDRRELTRHTVVTPQVGPVRQRPVINLQHDVSPPDGIRQRAARGHARLTKHQHIRWSGARKELRQAAGARGRAMIMGGMGTSAEADDGPAVWSPAVPA